MLDTLIALYGIVTDFPLLVSIVAALALPGFASKAYEFAQRRTQIAALHWVAGLGAGAAVLAVYWAIWRVLGLPIWIGWLL